MVIYQSLYSDNNQSISGFLISIDCNLAISKVLIYPKIARKNEKQFHKQKRN